MKRFYQSLIGVVSLLMVAFVSVAASEPLDSGLHGMKWASSVAAYPDLVKIYENAAVSYYVKAGTFYHLADARVDRLVYGFYNGKLFAGFIELATPLQFTNLKNHFSTRYGDPAVAHDVDGNRTVYRWKNGPIKIKLKLREAGKGMKLAIYYTPLSERINEAHAEQDAQVSGEGAPSDQTDESVDMPLFNF